MTGFQLTLQTPPVQWLSCIFSRPRVLFLAGKALLFSKVIVFFSGFKFALAVFFVAFIVPSSSASKLIRDLLKLGENQAEISRFNLPETAVLQALAKLCIFSLSNKFRLEQSRKKASDCFF